MTTAPEHAIMYTLAPPPGLTTAAFRSNRRKKLRAYYRGWRQGASHERSVHKISTVYREYHDLISTPVAKCSNVFPDMSKQIEELAEHIEQSLSSDEEVVISKSCKLDPEQHNMYQWLSGFFNGRRDEQQRIGIFLAWKEAVSERKTLIMRRVFHGWRGVTTNCIEQRKQTDTEDLVREATCEMLRLMIGLHRKGQLRDSNQQYHLFARLPASRALSKRYNDWPTRSHEIFCGQFELLQSCDDAELEELLDATDYGYSAVRGWLIRQQNG